MTTRARAGVGGAIDKSRGDAHSALDLCASTGRSSSRRGTNMPTLQWSEEESEDDWTDRIAVARIDVVWEADHRLWREIAILLYSQIL